MFCANGSNEVLQTLLLTYGGPGRRGARLRADLRAAQPHRPHLTGTEVVVGARRDDFGVDPDAARALIEQHQPEIVFLCSPNNPTGTVEPRATVEAILDVAPGLVIVDEAYGEFAPRVRARARRRRAPARRDPHVLEGVVARRAAGSASASRPRGSVAELEKVVLPYHLDVSTQLAGTTALRFRAEMEARVAFLVEDRERLFAALDELDGVTVFPSGANFLLFRIDGGGPAEKSRGHAIWEALVERGCSCGTSRAGPASRTASGSRSAPRPRTRRSCPPWRTSCASMVAMTSRHDHEHRITKETDVEVDLVIDGVGKVSASTGIPFFDHMLEQLGKHGGFDLTIAATGDLEVDTHHTVEDVGIVLGTAFKKALGDKAGVRRFASGLFPLDEALVQVAVDLSGRPFLVYEIDPISEWIGTFDPQLAEEFWRGFAFAAGITLHLRSLSGKNGHHVIEASFKGVARCLRGRGAGRGSRAPVDEGHPVDLFPAIDVRGGNAVRLLRGDFAAETVYDADPVAVARRFEADGARWIHVVDLDAARTGEPANLATVAAIAGAVDCRVQVGGGVRSVEAAARCSTRAWRGSWSAPPRSSIRSWSTSCARRYPGRVAVGLDARGQEVAVRGWVEGSGTDLVELGRRFADVRGGRADRHRDRP